MEFAPKMLSVLSVRGGNRAGDFFYFDTPTFEAVSFHPSFLILGDNIADDLAYKFFA